MKAAYVILACLVACGGIVWWISGQSHHGLELLNVSYDPTRELWRDLNRHFQEKYAKEHGGAQIAIEQSHGGSSTQAGKVLHGLEADVVTLALWSDVDVLRKNRLIREGWEQRLPDHSVAYFSTIVFVVRQGNPKHIQDWSDLIQPGVEVVTPNPKTSGNGRLSFLAAWGAAYLKNHSEEEARDFVAELYQHVPVLDTGARGSSNTFAQRGIGDVHLTWENEAYLEMREMPGKLQLVYPTSGSIRAEPPVAVVDVNVDHKGTRAMAEEYLLFLWTEEAQEIVASHFYRPSNRAILKKHQDVFPDVKLFSVTLFVSGWDEAQKKFFNRGGVFDTMQRGK